MPRPVHGPRRGADDLASTDEVKIYKDEGEADDGKLAAENLTEEKLGLLTETEQVKCLDSSSSRSASYSSRLKLHSSAELDARVADYYNPFSVAGRLPFSPFFNPYQSYSPYRTGSAIAAAGFGGVPVSPLLPSAAQYFNHVYGTGRSDHFQTTPPGHPSGLSSSLHLNSRTSGFPQTSSLYQLPPSILTPPSQFPHSLFTSDLPHGSCFDHFSRNAQCGYPMSPFSASYLTPSPLGGFPLPRFNSPADYFSAQPGISSTYPGISHPALVAACSAAAASAKDLAPPPPSCYSPSDGGRSLHSWFPRHCPSSGRTPSCSLSEPAVNCLSSPEPSGSSAIHPSPSDRAAGIGFSHRSYVSHRTTNGGPASAAASMRDRMAQQQQQQRSKASHIKKPLNAFMLFMKEMRSKVVDECTLKESAAINQILGRKWHSLDRAEQARYYEMARREKLLHKQRFPGWSARDNYALLVRKAKRKVVVHRPVHRPSLSADGNDRDGSGAKKCRARYGLEHQNRWCKPCRRKKRCIRFADGSDDASSVVAPAAADSTSGADLDPQQPTSARVCSEPASDRRVPAAGCHVDGGNNNSSSGSAWPSPNSSSCSATAIAGLTASPGRCHHSSPPTTSIR